MVMILQQIEGNQWEKKGVWKRMMDVLVSYTYRPGKLRMKVAVVDSSDVAAKKRSDGRLRRTQEGIREQDTYSRQ